MTSDRVGCIFFSDLQNQKEDIRQGSIRYVTLLSIKINNIENARILQSTALSILTTLSSAIDSLIFL